MTGIGEVHRHRLGQGAAQERRRAAEPVQMRQRRHGYFPHVFVWRGREYRVEAVERCWTISRRNGGGRIEGHCFRVRLPEGTCDLFQDAHTGAWVLQGWVR